MPAHTEAKRHECISRMVESAAGNSGVPVFSAVATKTGVCRATLRRWWGQKDKAPVKLAEPPDPAEVVKLDTARMAGLLDGKASDYHKWEFAQLEEDIGAANRGGRPVAPLRKLQREAREKYKAALDEERRGKGEKSWEQITAELVALVREAPPALVVALVQEARQRGIA